MSAKKFSLLLLDANVVIRLFELGIWDRILDACDVHLTRIVAEKEADFFVDGSEVRRPIDLGPSEQDGRITVHEIPASKVAEFRSRFTDPILDRLDDGETESLALLVESDKRFLICSSDAIVFRVLGALCIGEQGLSLEEILQRIGLNRKLKWQFSKAFRLRFTNQGFDEGIRGFGVRQ